MHIINQYLKLSDGTQAFKLVEHGSGLHICLDLIIRKWLTKFQLYGVFCVSGQWSLREERLKIVMCSVIRSQVSSFSLQIKHNLILKWNFDWELSLGLSIMCIRESDAYHPSISKIEWWNSSVLTSRTWLWKTHLVGFKSLESDWLNFSYTEYSA